MRRAGGGFRVSSYPQDEENRVVPPQNVEELRPWFMAVERARGRAVAIPAWNLIAHIMQRGVEWIWTMAHTLEQAGIEDASGIVFPLSTGEVISRDDSNEEESVDSWSPPQ